MPNARQRVVLALAAAVGAAALYYPPKVVHSFEHPRLYPYYVHTTVPPGWRTCPDDYLHLDRGALAQEFVYLAIATTVAYLATGTPKPRKQRRG